MFKRRDAGTILEEEPSGSYAARPSAQEAPPRVFEVRTPSQAYPHHREETQHTLNQEVSSEEVWKRQQMRGPVDMEQPETVLGEGICIKGQLEFQRFLRVDGEFEGELSSDGRIVVGPTGVVRANITLREGVIEGAVHGDITVKKLELRGDAKVFGNITATLLSVDEGVTINGQVHIDPTTSQ